MSGNISFLELSKFFPLSPGEYSFSLENGVRGLCWECSPLAPRVKAPSDVLESLMRLPIPDDSVLQISLYADHEAKTYEQVPVQGNDVIDEVVKAQTEFMGTIGANGNVPPVRNFRLFVSLRFPGEGGGSDLRVLAQIVQDILSSSGLKPKWLAAEGMDAVIGQLILGAKTGESCERVSTGKKAEDRLGVSSTKGQMVAGGRRMAVVVAKDIPKDIQSFDLGELTGGIWGRNDERNQINCPFLMTCNFRYDSRLRARLWSTLSYRGRVDSILSKFLPLSEKNIRRWVYEKEMLNRLEMGELFVAATTMLWLFEDNEQALKTYQEKAVRLWEAQGIVVDRKASPTPELLMAATPCGMAGDRKTWGRQKFFVGPVKDIAPLAPLVADGYIGDTRVAIPLVGRKGQLRHIDFFDPKFDNRHVLLTGPSGSGKTAFLRAQIVNRLAAGGMVRWLGISGGNRHFCELLGGQYCDLREPVSVNPFTLIDEPDNGVDGLAAFVFHVATGNDLETAPEDEPIYQVLVQHGVKVALASKGAQAELSDVRGALLDYSLEDTPLFPALSDPAYAKVVAMRMVANLAPFCAGGEYGQWFTGPCDIDFTNKLVVTDCENLRPRPALCQAITLALISLMGRDAGRGARGRAARMLVFDDVWRLLWDNLAMRGATESLVRCCYKSGAGAIFDSQSLLDLSDLGLTGKVILNHCAQRVTMATHDADRVVYEKIVDWDDHILRLAKSVSVSPPHYSEALVENPAGVGVARLFASPQLLALVGSNWRVIDFEQNLMKQGKTAAEVIRETTEI